MPEPAWATPTVAILQPPHLQLIVADVAQVAKRRGKSGEAVQAALEKLETILPDLINLNKMKASDWVRSDATMIS
jgi:hypothetical protein